jgi:hypothetical protein
MNRQVDIVRKDFRVRFDPRERWVWLDLASFRQPLLPEISIDVIHDFDRSIDVVWEGVQRRGDRDRLSWSARSTSWHKRYLLDVYDGHVEFHAEARGSAEIDSIRYFDTIPEAGFRRHFALTKHFNDRRQTGARAYSTGSPAAFRHVFCPEPNSYARQVVRSYDYGQISVNADLDHQGGNFIANPGLLCFAVAADPDCEWLGFGLAVEPGDYLFSEYEYLGGEEFALNLNSWGARRVVGGFWTPRMVIVPASTAHRAMARYVDVLRASGLVPEVRGEQPDWWGRPIVCGWGHQCYQADLFRVRSTPERPPDNAAYTLSCQPNYRNIVERLDDHQLPWGTLIIDERWFLAGGLKNVDEGRWPDLRGFIVEQHRRDRRVLLWWGPWDPEGVPAEQCVRYQPSDGVARKNRPGRLSKFGLPHQGKKLAIDVTLPPVRERIRDQVRLLLGPGPDGYDADGFKIDHVAAAPGLYDMAFPDGSARLFGIEAARECLLLLYETVKEVKPDALVIGQSPNPYFAGTQDMLRLGDIYTHHAESVAEEMSFRAAIARITDPSWLIDTDGWPMPSLVALREYVDLQPAIGVPSLYYVSHLDTTGEALTLDDYARIRRVWTRGR